MALADAREPPVLLGFLGDRVSPADTSKAWEVSQIGGTPHWLTERPPEDWPIRCTRCGANLSLLCQLSTPYSANRRSLYLFGCHRTSTCSLDAANWAAIRGVFPPAPDESIVSAAGFRRSSHENSAPHCIAETRARKHTCPAERDSYSESGGGGVTRDRPSEDTWSGCSDPSIDWLEAAFACVDLDKEKAAQQATLWNGTVASSTSATSKQDERARSEGLSTAQQNSACLPIQEAPAVSLPSGDQPPASVCTPRCRRSGEAEKATVTLSSGAMSGHRHGSTQKLNTTFETGVVSRSSDGIDAGGQLLPAYYVDVDEEPAEESAADRRLANRAQELWDDYQRRENDSTLAREEESDRAFLGGEAFDVEQYEAGTDKILRAFQRRLSRWPQQILRYSFSGKPLWIREWNESSESGLSGSPPRCDCCGASRVFEMQLMPTLLHAVEQKCPHIKEALLRSSTNLNWGVVVVFTCANDCVTDGGYTREFVVVQEGL